MELGTRMETFRYSQNSVITSNRTVQVTKMQTKQIIVVRNDLKMPTGILAAQVAHASMSPILELMKKDLINVVDGELACLNGAVEEWLNGSFTKVCLAVPDLESLLEIYEQASSIPHLPHRLILDEGRTCFKEPTYSCCGLGPWYSDDLDQLTGHLKLL